MTPKEIAQRFFEAGWNESGEGFNGEYARPRRPLEEVLRDLFEDEWGRFESEREKHGDTDEPDLALRDVVVSQTAIDALLELAGDEPE